MERKEKLMKKESRQDALDFSGLWDGIVTRWPHVPFAMAAAVIWGILAHGTVLFHKISIGDDSMFLHRVGVTTHSGRWFLEALGSLVRHLFGSVNLSAPLWSGFITIALIGLSACVVISLLGLKSKVSWIITAGLMTVFPMVASLLMYLFTAPYYACALLLTVSGTALLCRERRVLCFFGGVALLVLGMGIYQAYIPFALSLCLIFFVKTVLETKNWSWYHLLGSVLWYCAAFLLTVACYLMLTNLIVRLSGITLLDYKGISDMGQNGIADYLRRLPLSYKGFFQPSAMRSSANMFQQRLKYLYYLTLVGAAFYTAVGAAAIPKGKDRAVRLLSVLLAMAVFPLAANFIVVMADMENISSLMAYAAMSPMLLLCCLIDCLPLDGKRVKAAVPVRKAAVVLLMVFCLFYVRFDNAYYLKIEFYQQRVISHTSAIVGRIQSLDGYDPSMPVTYLWDSNDPNWRSLWEFDDIDLVPGLYTSAELESTMRLWCGFEPVFVEPEPFADLPQVRDMPSYPADGSVQIVNGTVVIKF